MKLKIDSQSHDCKIWVSTALHCSTTAANTQSVLATPRTIFEGLDEQGEINNAVSTPSAIEPSRLCSQTQILDYMLLRQRLTWLVVLILIALWPIGSLIGTATNNRVHTHDYRASREDFGLALLGLRYMLGLLRRSSVLFPFLLLRHDILLIGWKRKGPRKSLQRPQSWGCHIAGRRT